MLVLTRMPGQAIIIGNPPIARVVVERIRGDKVRISVTAGTTIPVDREEVFNAKRREEEEAARGM